MKDFTLLKWRGLMGSNMNNIETEHKFKGESSYRMNKLKNTIDSLRLFTVFTFVFLMGITSWAQLITVDGNPADWGVLENTQPSTYNHIADPFGSGVVDDQFTEGTKDFFTAANMIWADGQTKAKNDIANGAAFIEGTTLYFAGDKTSNNGDAQIGFWFYLNNTAPRVLQTNPKRSGDFTPEHAVGDLLVLIDFTGGGKNGTVSSYKWVGTGGAFGNGALDIVTSGTAAQNNLNVYSVPAGWLFTSATYDTNQFFEGSIDLGNTIISDACFSRFLVEARSSQELTASLDDFAAGEFNVEPQVEVNDISDCSENGPFILTADLDGGLGTLEYEWRKLPSENVIGTNSTLEVTESGQYSITVIGEGVFGGECPSQPAISNVSITTISAESTGIDTSCNGGSDGSVTITFSSGTGPYMVSFDGGAYALATSPKVFNNLTADTYAWKVKDANDCEKTGSQEVDEPTAVTAGSEADDVDCNGGNDGSVTITFSGGTGPYMVSFDGGAYALATSPKVFDNLTADTYAWKVKDANDCEKTGSQEVDEPTAVTASSEADDVDCNGGNDGSVTITFSGGTGPYMVSFDGGAYALATSPKVFDGLAADTYSWKVKDANDCEKTGSQEVDEPTAVTASSEANDVDCNGGNDGSVTITFSGGTGPYMVSFDGGAYALATSPKVFDGLAADTYSWKVKDANDCEKTGSQEVDEPTAVTASSEADDVDCNGGNDGSVTITFSGGTGPYMVSFDGGAYALATSPKVFDGLAADTYSWKVKDANDCEKTGSQEVDEPTAVTASSEADDVDCNGGNDGTVTITFSGGTGPYMVSFDGGAYALATSPKVFDGLAADTYSWKVKDANDCEKTGSQEVDEPTAVTASSEADDVDCNGGNDGTVTITFSGGTGPYMVSFDGGAYALATSPKVFDGLAADTYSWKVKDANDCEKTGSQEVDEPTAVTASSEADDVDCNGGNDGSVTITFSGGTGPYMISFDGGAYALATSPKVFDGLAADTYSWKVKDANDCEKTGSQQVGEASSVIASSEADDVDCNGGNDGTVTITFSGGTGPYMVSFDGGAYALATSPKVFDGLAADTYSWKVKDANDCEKTGSQEVDEPTAVTASSEADNVGCNGGNDGSVTITFSGGTGPYMISFDGGAYALATSPKVFDNLTADTYAWKVKDANDCEKTGSQEVDEPTAVTASSEADDVDCNGGNDGTVTITFSGGTGPYMVSFDGGAYALATSPKVFDGLAADTYSWKVKDANDCEKTGSQEVDEPTAVTASSEADDVDCNGGNDGTVTITFSGGTGPYMVSFDGGAYALATSPKVFNNLTADTYAWKVKDANDCEKTGSQQVGEASSVIASSEADDVDCNGGNDGSVTITFSGGTGPYMVSFDGGAYALATSPKVFDGLAADTYSWKVKDANDCEKTGSKIVTEPDKVTPPEFEKVQADCLGGPGGLTFKNLEPEVELYYSLDGADFILYDGTIILSVGLHKIVVKFGDDACISDDIDVEIVTPEPNDPFTLNPEITQPDCETLQGTIKIRVGENTEIDTGFFNYTVSDGVTTYYNGVKQPAGGFIDLPPGNYIITGLSEDGCNSGRVEVILEEPICEVFEGCTLGYWKNHTDRWTCYSTCTLYSEVFGTELNPVPSQLQGLTLLEVLNLGGGGIYNLGRQSVAALLNTCHGDVNYEILTTDELIAYVNSSFGNAGEAGSFLDSLNNAGCTLGGSRATTSPSSGCDAPVNTKPGKNNKAGFTADFKAYPVPFKGSLNIQYEFNYKSDVSIEIFDLQGRMLRTYKARKVSKGDVTALELDFATRASQLYVIKVKTDRDVFSKNIISDK